MWRLLAIAAFPVLGAAPGFAQLNLPHVPLQLPQIPAAPITTPPDVAKPAGSLVRDMPRLLDPGNLLESRQIAIRELLRRHPDVLERSAAGDPIVRGELLLLAPSEATLDAARAAGFRVSVERRLAPLGERLVLVRAPAGLSTAEALERLRALDAAGFQDFNHVYVPAGTLDGPSAAAERVPAPATHPPHMKIGLVDGGIDVQHPALRGADIRPFGCERPRSSAHGTAVASLLVGRERKFSGAATGATLYAADVYCGRAAGGSAAFILEALAWLAREQVPVINVSLVGPANRTLERAIQELAARGHVIVAAAGNDGPASPPLYPAGYPDVVAVTGVDPQKQVLPEAARGPHIAFSAPGSEMAVAQSGESGFSRARGTSFAAPLVAGLLAVAYEPGGLQSQSARRAIEALVRDAVDLGPPGRDPTYGHGFVAERLRVDPLALR